MHGAKTMARCVIGVEGWVTILKTVTVLGIAATVHVMVMTVLIVSALTTSAMSLKIAKSIPLTPTSNVATALPLTMTLMSKGC